MEDLIRDFENYMEKNRFVRPADVDRVLARNAAIGKNLAVCIFLHGDAETGITVFYDYYLTARKGDCDLETLKTLTARHLDFHIGRFKNYYHMTDGQALLIRAKDAVPKIKNFDEYARLIKVVQNFFVEISYWIDISMPWAETSEAFTKAMAKKNKGKASVE